MIYLTKGQKLFNNEGMVVCDPTGYYNDGDSVACAVFHMPEEPVCRYEAKFIAYGDQVYTITDPEKLTEEILKIDPASLFGKDSQEIATDKMVNQITTVQEATPQAAPTVSPVVAEPIASSPPTVEPEVITPPVTEPTATTTPTVDPVLSEQATSSPVTEIITPPPATTSPETITDILSNPADSTATTTNP